MLKTPKQMALQTLKKKPTAAPTITTTPPTVGFSYSVTQAHINANNERRQRAKKNP